MTRRRLGIGTCLTGAAAALLLGSAPATARTSPQLSLRMPHLTMQARNATSPIRAGMLSAESLPQDLTMLPVDRLAAASATVPTAGIWISGAPRAETGRAALTPIADLTVVGTDVVVNEGDIATTGDDEPGIRTVASGTTDITAGNISTQGRSSAGVHAYGYGDITIHTGSVEAHGYRSDGIYANNNVGGNSGGIEITAGDVSTSGYASSGIRAAAYNGSATITANSVKTSGYGADGIYGWSYLGDTNVNVGDVETSGTGGRGITAYSGGTTTVNVDNVSTTGAGYGTFFDAGAIKAVGAVVDVHAGTVNTTGDYSSGIYANQNLVHDNGQDDHHISVTADSVTTSGLGSDGIHVGVQDPNSPRNTYDIAVDAGAVTTSGDYAWGVATYNRYGNTDIKMDDVQTSGFNSTGILAQSIVGNVTVDAGKVTTSGDGAAGIFGYSPLGSVAIQAGTVETHGDQSAGIVGASFYGNVAIHADSVTTTGTNAHGVYSYAGGFQQSGGMTNNVDVGSVKTSGDGAIGVYAISIGQQIDTTITAGSVETQGYGATGIRAVATGMGDDIAIHAGTVSTAGTYADGIDAINYSTGGKIKISADKVTTSGDVTAGIFTYAQTGDTNVTAGEVSTTGYGSFGISLGDVYGDVDLSVTQVSTTGDSAFGMSVGGENVSIDAGTVTTKGYLGVGVSAGAKDDLTINAGTISTEGDLSRGIDASASHVTITAGDVSTAGFGSNAINAVAYGPDGTVDITTTGHIAITGDYADAIAASAAGGIGVHNKGDISTAGDGGRGVYAVSLGDGDITVDGGGDITTKGLGGKGVYAITNGGSITVDQGDISTAGDNAAGVYAVTLTTGADSGTNAITVHTGDVTTSGYNALGIRTFANTADTDVSVTAGNIATSGDHAWGVYASTLSGDVSINVGDVTTTGAGAEGIAAASVYGNVNVTANNVHVAADYINAIDAVSASYQGDVHVTAHDVSGGAYGSAIYASGHSVVIHTTGTVEKTGSYAAIDAFAHGGDATITNDGEIATVNSGTYGSFLAHGIYTRADGNVTINGTGSISTEGQLSYGVAAYSNGGGAISVTQDSITTTGGQGQGVVAVTSNRTGPYGTNGAGGITVCVGSIATEGFGASGMLLSDNTQLGSAVATVTGDLTTKGDQARGVSIYSANQTAGAHLHNVSTTGYYSQAVHLDGHRAEFTFDGAVSTTGVLSTAVVAYAGNGGISITGTGPISATGDYFSSGIRASSPGDIDISVDGLISTQGRGSNGIEVTERKRHSEVYPYDPPADGDADVVAADAVNGFPFPDPRNKETPATGSTITIDASAIQTAGMNSDGIMASTTTGNVNIHAGSVAVTGAHSIGIFAEGRNLTADVGNVSSAQANAIALQGYDSTQLTVHGAVQGGADGILLQSYGNNLTVAKGATITGAVNGVTIDATPHVTPIVHYWGYAPQSYIGDDEPQPVPPANPAPGTASIANAGTITAGSGYAITVSGGGATVDNSGVVIGAVKFSRFADTFTNSGQFIATKDSDFGGGGDTFLNSGSFTLAHPAGTATAQATGGDAMSVALLNLATFRNTGIIDLRNGVGGDVLTLSGKYVGDSNAKLGLDITGDGVDKLAIGGAATGTTSVLLDVAPSGARLMSQPETLVQAGEGTAANAFTLANDQVGLIQYNLAFDSTSHSFGLTSQAGSSVYRVLKLTEGAQAIWNQSGDAWSSHMAALRDTDLDGNRLWGQAFGQLIDHDQTRDVGGSAYDLDYRQDFFGGQAGYDLTGNRSDNGGFVVGLSTGYVGSHLNFREAATRTSVDAANVGAYASFHTGPFFANLLGQYDHYWVGVNDRMAGWSDRVGGDGYGAKGEIGARLGGDRFFAEPIASLAWQHTDIGALSALGQTIDPDGGTSLSGSLGARLGARVDLAGGAKATVYVRGAYVHEFEGQGGLLFQSGGTSQQLSNLTADDYGQAALGVNISSSGPLSGFIEGDATLGKGTSGGGGRVGIRFKF